jgi:hypothetical protein
MNVKQDDNVLAFKPHNDNTVSVRVELANKQGFDMVACQVSNFY